MACKVTSDYILTDDDLSHSIKVFAGPGAGKTHFLVENVKNIISSNVLLTSGKARRVLCITYTNSAVDEIKHRLEQYSDYADAYTIHGFIIENIIKPFQEDLIEIMKNDFGIEVSKKGMITSQIEGLGILHGIDKEDLFRFIREYNSGEYKDDDLNYSKNSMGKTEVDNKELVNAVTSNIDYCAKFSHPRTIKNEHVIPIKKYIWSVVRKLTHDEILYFGYRILQENPTALYALRVKYPFIFVDEFQDTNPVQTLLLKKIGEKSSKIIVVGDIAQSIYSFQGAKPSDFLSFKIDSNNDLEYSIDGNRRSTNNIVNFCNFLRRSDDTVVQESIKPYKNTEEKETSESKVLHFLIGINEKIKDITSQVINGGGVVLTRTWAAAFNYIQYISEDQANILRMIYNSYFNTPIQLRDEIIQFNNVLWVRAFRFIFKLWESYNNGSFIDIIRAFNLYAELKYSDITPKIIFQVDSLAKEIFSQLTDNDKTCEIISKFNDEIKKECYSDLYGVLNCDDFTINIFDEHDSDDLINNVNNLTWTTAYKLFTEVFSENSKYMTVHQAKGLEWNKVIVSLTPTRNDRTSMKDVYDAIQICDETAQSEFARMYYVACSRAIDDLYIHIISGITGEEIKNSLECYIKKTGFTIPYEIIEEDVDL